MALLNCPECKKEVSSTATSCPNCGYRSKKKTGSFTWTGIIIIVVVVGWVMIEMPTEDNTSNRDFTNERLAYNYSKDHVLHNIKLPQTATFPRLLVSKDHINDLGGGRYQINSWVDSQNSFGDTIRTKFSCIMINKGDSYEWEIENLMLDNITPVTIDSAANVKEIKDSLPQIVLVEDAKTTYNKTFNLRKKYIGFKYDYPKSMDFIAEYGSPETLNGTDNNKWIVYFPKGNFTVVLNKKTNIFENICVGKNPNLKYDVTAELSKMIGKKMKYYDYVDIISSIRYGGSEKLGMKNCINKDCVEYFSKGNFTTVAYHEFNDIGDFVTLKKIAIGRVPKLNEY